jgi:hypothetical protein
MDPHHYIGHALFAALRQNRTLKNILWTYIYFAPKAQK